MSPLHLQVYLCTLLREKMSWGVIQMWSIPRVQLDSTDEQETQGKKYGFVVFDLLPWAEDDKYVPKVCRNLRHLCKSSEAQWSSGNRTRKKTPKHIQIGRERKETKRPWERQEQKTKLAVNELHNTWSLRRTSSWEFLMQRRLYKPIWQTNLDLHIENNEKRMDVKKEILFKHDIETHFGYPHTRCKPNYSEAVRDEGYIKQKKKKWGIWREGEERETRRDETRRRRDGDETETRRRRRRRRRRDETRRDETRRDETRRDERRGEERREMSKPASQTTARWEENY